MTSSTNMQGDDNSLEGSVAERVPDYLLRLGNPAVGLCSFISAWATGAILLSFATTAAAIAYAPNGGWSSPGLLAVRCLATSAGIAVLALLRDWQREAVVTGAVDLRDGRLRLAQILAALMMLGGVIELLVFRESDPIVAALHVLFPMSAATLLRINWVEPAAGLLLGLAKDQARYWVALFLVFTITGMGGSIQTPMGWTLLGIGLTVGALAYLNQWRARSLMLHWREQGIHTTKAECRVLRMRFRDEALRRLPRDTILSALPENTPLHIWLMQLVARLRKEHGLPYYEPDLAPEDRDT